MSSRRGQQLDLNKIKYLKMQMQCKRPRELSQRYHYKFVERCDMINDVLMILAFCAVFLIIGMLQRIGISSLELVVVVLLVCLARVLSDEAMKRPLSSRPRDSRKRLRFSDFEGARRDQYFFQRFRFRKEHFIQFMTAIELYDEESREFKKIKLDRYRHFAMADTAMLIFLARLSTAGTYISMMDEFGMDEKQISRCFNLISKYLYHKYAYRLSKIEIWEKHFDTFAEKMTIYGSPFPNLIGIIDGNFMRCSRPGGAGNWISTMDQRVIYSGKQKTHGLKFLAVVFPNGFVSLFGPVAGAMHDATLLDESGWAQYLYNVETQTGKHFCLFGDSAFGCCRYIQSMLKGALLPGGRYFNALMSRIRIHIENVFALQSNIFNFLSHEQALKIGTSPVHEHYINATFLMNIRNILYGNQFLSIIGPDVRLRITIDDFLKMQ